MTDLDDVRLAGPRLAIRVAELIRRAVAQSGLQQREIAERMGISESRLSQIVNGDGNLHTATVARLFAATHCALDLRVFDHDGHEVEIQRRRHRAGRAQTAVYIHPVEAEDGSIHPVVSYAHNSVEGTPRDLPIRVKSAADARKLNESFTSIEFALEVESVRV